MVFKKRKLAEAELGYMISSQFVDGVELILAAPEGDGPSFMFNPPEYKQKTLTSGPGGCMGFAAIPGKDGAILMITKFYPIFKAEDAGIDLLQPVHGLDQPWISRRIIDLPFIHRMAVVRGENVNYLIAATVCGGKDFQDDWSRPGKVYVGKIPDKLDEAWDLTPLDLNLHINHGMTMRASAKGTCVYVSGVEGVFAIEPPRTGSDWTSTQILTHEVSEIAFADLDDDGIDEIVTIEPFHGNKLAVYKQIDSTWQKISSAALAFGHGLWAGSLEGQNCILVGNRAEKKNLCCYRVVSKEPFHMELIVVDESAGTTNLDVIRSNQRDRIISSNPGHNEYAIYEVNWSDLV